MNTHGIRGRNIPCDLHQEHLNRICKRAIRNLRANQTETAITRAGKVLGTLYPVLMQYDMQTHVADTTRIHHAPTSQKDRDIIIRELQRLEVFPVCKNANITHFQDQEILKNERDLGLEHVSKKYGNKIVK